MGFFQWITEGVRRAVVEGVEQAADDINSGGTDADIVFHLPTHRGVPRLSHEKKEVQPVTNGQRKVIAKR